MLGISFSRALAVSFALAISLFFGSTTLTRADVVWTLTDVPMDDGGLLNGHFSINVYGYLSDWNLTTTGGSSLPGATYLP